MRRLLICAALFLCAHAASQDVQVLQPVKGGHSSFQYKGGDTSRFYNNFTQQGYSGQHHGSSGHGVDVGVCFKEVPTASLVKDPSHVPTGNGSRSDLSRIRACCDGYRRNIHNFLICDPVCENECVNGLCTAPNTCSCFPDHVRNLAGFCVATCPIGCQNGHCSGGECLCKEGFKLDQDSKFCLPSCRGNCGGVGNCTAPDTCKCNPGFTATTDGSCQGSGVPTSNTGCTGGACTENYTYRCPPGYSLKDARCFPECNGGCGSDARCVLPNMCSAYDSIHTMVPYRIPNNNQYPSQGPGQNNNNFYNPNQGSNYPQYPSSQYKPTENPQQLGQEHIRHPQGQNQSQPSNNEQYPQNNQAHRYPPSPPPPHATTIVPYNPSKPITHNVTYPTQPLYPGNQVGPNSTSYSHGQYPGYNQPTQRPDFNQGSYPLYPSLPSRNDTYPSQYPQYPTNQINPSGPGAYPYPQQNQYPQYPSNQQGPNSTYQNQYPPYGGSQYPSSQQGHYPGQSNYGNNYPSSQFNPYNRNPYDQFAETPQCSEPCVNGACMGGNRCRCHPGYIPDENDSTGNRCKPNCPGGCPNGYCEAPHTCACDEGYFKDTSVKGRPACVKRIRRSVDQPINVGDLLVFEIPDYASE